MPESIDCPTQTLPVNVPDAPVAVPAIPAAGETGSPVVPPPAQDAPDQGDAVQD